MKVITLEDLEKLKYSDFEWPIVSTLQNRGGSEKRKVIIDEIIENNEFSEEVLAVLTNKGSGSKIRNMISWSRFYLKEKGYVKSDSSHGLWELTDKGIGAIETEFLNAIAKEETFHNNAELENYIDEESIPWRVELKEALLKMSSLKFEQFARSLVAKMGVDIDGQIGMSAVADGGLDGFGYLKSDDFRTTRVAIQAKCWTQPIGSPAVRDFRGAMDIHNAEFGIFITTSTFSKKAKEESRLGTRVITLIDGDEIADLVAKYQLYVKPIEAYELGEFYRE